MKSKARNLVTALIGASLATCATADVLVSNLSESSIFTASSTGANTPNNVYASQFTTGADLSEILGATARLRNGSGFGIATYQAYIYTDSGSGPGSVVATFDTMPTIADGGGTANVSFSSVAGIALNANSTYWFAIRNTTGRYMGWETTGSDAESSTAGWTIDDDATYRSANQGASWQDYTSTYGGKVMKYSLIGNTIPAPGAFALLTAGGAIAARRRRR